VRDRLMNEYNATATAIDTSDARLRAWLRKMER
jgi:hypothetical protein